MTIVEDDALTIVPQTVRIPDTELATYKSHPVWSDDGEKIAYCNYKNCTQLLMFSDNNDTTTLFQFDDTIIGRFDISPSGKQILYRSYSDKMLHIYSIVDKSTKILAPDLKGAYFPLWSPDGRYITFGTENEYPGSYRNIWIVDESSTNIRKITREDGHYAHPSWSADSKELVFYGYVNRSYGLFVVNIENNNVRRIATVDSTKIRTYPSFSPDGSLIVFQKKENDTTGIWLMSSEGGAERKLTNKFRSVYYPVWSLDGKSIYFYASDGVHSVSIEDGISKFHYKCPAPKWTLYKNSIIIQQRIRIPHLRLVDLINSQANDLTQFDVNKSDCYPDWLDEEHVLFVRNNNFWKVSAVSKEEQIISSDSIQNKFNPEVSPDGSYIIFDDGFDIFHYNLLNGVYTNLSKNINENLIDPTISPDGKHIACCTSYALKIFTINSDLLLEKNVILGEYRNPDWSGINNHIAVVSNGTIYVISVKDWKQQFLSNYGYHPTWSPDGNRLAFSFPNIYIATVFIDLL